MDGEMTVKELGDRWAEVGNGELRIQWLDGFWRVRALRRSVVGADLESAVRALLAVGK